MIEKKQEPADTEEFLVSVWRGGWASAGDDIAIGRGRPSMGHRCPYAAFTALGKRRAAVWIDGYLKRWDQWERAL